MIDLDGTLLDTAPDLEAALNRTLIDFDREPLSANAVRNLIGKGIAHLIREAFAQRGGADAAQLARAGETYAAHYARTNGRSSRRFPGVQEGLDQFRAMGMRLACVTNKAARFTTALLDATGLLASFDLVVTPDDAGVRKPDPGIFLHACAALGVSPGNACVIGDSANDAVAARAAGCRFLLVPYGYREGMELHEIACDAIVDSLLDASHLLDARS